jgi:hypothetical protein
MRKEGTLQNIWSGYQDSHENKRKYTHCKINERMPQQTSHWTCALGRKMPTGALNMPMALCDRSENPVFGMPSIMFSAP